MRILALDMGDRRIGVALSDQMQLIAQGICTYERKSAAADLDFISALVEQYRVVQLVIGLPRNMNGTYGERAEKTWAFGDALSGRISVPVGYWDERLSTVAAERILIEADVSRKKRKKVIDKMAAVNILQSYLDFLRNKKEMEGKKNG